MNAMTPSLPRTGRLSVFLLALAWTATSFGVVTTTPPLAAQTNAYYVAQLAEPATDRNAVAGGVAWTCAETTCVANKGTSRPMRVCRGLARKVGAISSFTADGETLADEKLTRCNGN
jgi:hypothetical protein